MTDHTGTLWVILMTPKKNILTRISRLKKYGKIKIEELKVMYGKKSSGGWVFQILGQPKSRTFSFHDGDVILKTQRGYNPLRKHGFHVYLILAGLFFLWLSGRAVWVCFETQQQIPARAPMDIAPVSETPQETIEKVKIQQKFSPPDLKNNPISHQQFLDAKKQFQYGQISTSSKNFQAMLEDLNEEDRRQASAMISESYYLQCSKWIQEHEERKAVLACEKAANFSKHFDAIAFLNRQEEKAKKLYLEGYTMQKFDPAGARKKYALVLQSAKTKSTWRGKAQYQLRKLKG